MKVRGVKAKTKKLNELTIADFVKELHSNAELIRAVQDEKQSLIDEFNSESRRFLVGKLSKRTVDSSIKKTKTEMKKLDEDLRNAIKESTKLLKKIDKQLHAQAPKRFRIGSFGIEEIKRKGGKKR